MLKGRTSNITLNDDASEINLEVVYFDDETDFKVKDLFSIANTGKITAEIVTAAVVSHGQQYKDLINIKDLIAKLIDKEITI